MLYAVKRKYDPMRFRIARLVWDQRWAIKGTGLWDLPLTELPSHSIPRCDLVLMK